MILFNLDGTLADCEHRRHFVDPRYRDDCYFHFPATLTQSEGWYYKDVLLACDPPKAKKFVPDWQAFYEACDKDGQIEPVIEILDGIYQNTVRFWEEVQIWSGRCESVREKTIKWLEENILWDGLGGKISLKMRPIGDSTPDDELKERWLDEALAAGKTIDFVFDSHKHCVGMWRRRGIFVFNCCQHEKEF